MNAKEAFGDRVAEEDRGKRIVRKQCRVGGPGGPSERQSMMRGAVRARDAPVPWRAPIPLASLPLSGRGDVNNDQDALPTVYLYVLRHGVKGKRTLCCLGVRSRRDAFVRPVIASKLLIFHVEKNYQNFENENLVT